MEKEILIGTELHSGTIMYMTVYYRDNSFYIGRPKFSAIEINNTMFFSEYVIGVRLYPLTETLRKMFYNNNPLFEIVIGNLGFTHYKITSEKSRRHAERSILKKLK